MFADINVKVVEVLQNYFERPEDESVWLNIQNLQYKRAVTAGFKIGMMLFAEKRIRLLRTGKQYIEYSPPAEIGWSGEKYRKYLENAWKTLQLTLLEEKEVYVHAFCGIIKSKEAAHIDFSPIKFREIYWERVNETLSRDTEYVGIHIRRTDHDTAIQESTTRAFEKHIDAILDKRPLTRFFLSTDDIMEEKELIRRYKDSIVVQKQKNWGRTNSDEMQSGIIDLLCLSRCVYVLGSYTSVFSFFASQYGNKQLIICKNNDND